MQQDTQPIMQLNKIKISGFKSFVDPTVIELPSNLVAVVGPNGCGKSNIIDAVTWVMGESSPKYLRGESSTDVIFNGSSARKPVGQASVELVFDNQSGAIGGEYAKYAEISVKRQINRSSESVYFLNGVRCRKRDVVDIFRGTGLGPRSYSIVGQNMITRIIESKPEEMRVFLEEAAGISKYKDRRHETELRIKHTRENLDRVNDLRGELEKQLNHLKSQANAAEKYKVLKQEERVLRSELYAVEYRELDDAMSETRLSIQREETALEGKQADLGGVERDVENMHQEQRAAQETLQDVQRRYYAIGNEITRIEQDILHHEQRQQQWQTDLCQVSSDCDDLNAQLEESEDQLRELEQEILEIEPQLNSASEIAARHRQTLADAEESMQDWQGRWEEFNEASAKTAQTAQVEKTRIEHFDSQINELQNRRDKLQSEQGRYNFTELNQELEGFSNQLHEVEDILEDQQEQLGSIKQEIATLYDAQKGSNSHLDEIRGQLQGFRGKQASLEALQQTALGQRENAASGWISEHQLSDKPRLAQHIKVESGWELAAEKILGFDLQAICADNRSDLLDSLATLPEGNVSLFTPRDSTGDQGSQSAGAETLLSKIDAPWSLESLLSGVYVAETLEQALTLCQSIKPYESVITRDGVWVNQSWVKVLRDEDPAQGVIRREQELKDLAEKIESATLAREELEAHIEERREEILLLEQKRDQLQSSYNDRQSQSAQIRAEHKMKHERINEFKQAAERSLTAWQDCCKQLEVAEKSLRQSREVWSEAAELLESEANNRDQLLQERDVLRNRLKVARDEMDAQKDNVHSMQIRMETAKSQKESLQQTIKRMHAQQASLNERRIHLQAELDAMPATESLKVTLEDYLEKHSESESELNKAREQQEALEQQYREFEAKRHKIDQELAGHRNKLEKLRVESQGWKVKSESILEQFAETEASLEEVLQSLPEGISVEEWQEKLEQVTRRIARLGAINLVAIEEYATCLERKEYLDRQVDDLEGALTTLEDAIAKIDRETRQKFKETFDRVNQRFQELFPTIFGGGKAYLELTSDELLEAGVAVMACPPGKRNSTIYLLSGGEKSLTALALIFSIFYLNPAPFCLLDEVDAALDDANVLRFTRLVKSMADKTQFIFISHNKIAIEMGEHLMGVTMHEPGVSRLVSVDIAKAMDLAGA